MATITKLVLTPKGDYIPLDQSGLRALGIDSDEKIELHNKMQEKFNEERKKEKESYDKFTKIQNEVREIAKRNGLEEYYKEIESRELGFKYEVCSLLAFGLKHEDMDTIRRFVTEDLADQ